MAPASKFHRNKVDWAFVSAREGGCLQNGYLIVKKPHKDKWVNYTAKCTDGSAEPWQDSWEVAGKMGVTIGTGVDLGQMTAAEIDRLGLSSETAASLRRFAHPVIGKAAGRLLGEVGGLKVSSPTDLQRVDDARASGIYSKLRALYDHATRVGAIPFDQLSSGIQTGIFSFAYHHGPDWGTKPTMGPKGRAFWRHIVDQNFKAAIDELETGYKDPNEKKRRALEAEQIRRGVAEMSARG